MPPPTSVRLASPALLPAPRDLSRTGLPAAFAACSPVSELQHELPFYQDAVAPYRSRDFQGARNDIRAASHVSQGLQGPASASVSNVSQAALATSALPPRSRPSRAFVTRWSPRLSRVPPPPWQETASRAVKTAGAGAWQGAPRTSMCQVASCPCAVSLPVRWV